MKLYDEELVIEEIECIDIGATVAPDNPIILRRTEKPKTMENIFVFNITSILMLQ